MASLKQKIEEAESEAKSLKDRIKQIKTEKHKTDLSKMSIERFSNEGVDPRDRRLLRGHYGKVYAMHWASDSLHLVSASQDGNLIVWDANAQRKEFAIPLVSSFVMTCAYGNTTDETPSPFIACGGLDNVISVFEVDHDDKNKKIDAPKCELTGHDGYISCCRFIGEKNILSASGDGKCIYWDLHREAPQARYDGHSMDVMCAAVNPVDKNMFASGSVDETVKVWDMRTNTCTHTFGQKGDKFHTSDINSVAFFPGGNSIGTGSDDSTCRVFDIRCYGQVNKFEYPDSSTSICAVSFSKTGRLLFAGNEDQRCFGWDLFGSTDTPACVMNKHNARVSCIGVTPNGHALGTGSWDQTLYIWA